MNLNLTRPIVFFDLETTGVDLSKDRIVEISMLKVNPDQSEETFTTYINPLIPMSASASEVTGITDEMLKDKPVFKEVAPKIYQFIENCDLAGFNSNKFDIPMLVEQLLNVDIDVDITKIKTVDVQVIYHKKEQRTLSAAYKYYIGKDLEGAHGAQADTRATYEVLKAQLDMYSDLENDIEKLSEFSSYGKQIDPFNRVVLNDKSQEVFNFGKYKGVPILEVFKKEPGYYKWLMDADFPKYTKQIFTRIFFSLKLMNKFND